MDTPTSKYKFSFGQQIHHKLFDYYGVIVAVDSCFKGDDKWYEMMARSRPPKDKPWYHILVDGAEHTTYVAERNLEPDETGQPILHPLIDALFGTGFNKQLDEATTLLFNQINESKTNYKRWVIL